MRVTRFLLFIFALIASACPVQAVTLVNGEDFVALSNPQPTEPGKKVEVIEFFAYYCPHCNALDQSLTDWVKAQGDNIVFKRVHTSITGEAVPQQRLFYTLETMGKVDEYHHKIFYAIHDQKKHLDSDEDILAFMIQQGIDRQKFVDTYNSFTVQSKVNRALQMQTSYAIKNWPTIVLDGRLATSPPIVGSKMETYNENIAQDLMLKVMDDLVLQLHEERSK